MSTCMCLLHVCMHVSNSLCINACTHSITICVHIVLYLVSSRTREVATKAALAVAMMVVLTWEGTTLRPSLTRLISPFNPQVFGATFLHLKKLLGIWRFYRSHVLNYVLYTVYLYAYKVSRRLPSSSQRSRAKWTRSTPCKVKFMRCKGSFVLKRHPSLSPTRW